MRISPILLAAFLAAPLAAAAAPRTQSAPSGNPNGPKLLGRFEDWTAATHQEAGQTVCYAFTRAASSSPAIPGRTDVVLTVTERPAGRDAVAISAGFAYPQGAEVTVQVDQAALSFYTSQRSAFARDGAATVAALRRGHQAVARSPTPRGSQVVDTFRLRGFTDAYAAIVKACPAR
jgi:invasion protein IalB